MRKIPTLFVRDFNGTLGPPGRYVLPDVAPGCEWVLAGEGVATRKLDGTAVLIRDGEPYKRREVKAGQEPPSRFEEVDADETTGKRFGWVPAERHDPADRWLFEAFDRQAVLGPLDGGTYELVGPKVQGNPEKYDEHAIVRHGLIHEPDAPRDYEGLHAFLAGFDGEGIVWHHPDGRMAKIKRRDFPR